MNWRHWWKAWRGYGALVWEGWKIGLAKRLLANIGKGQQARLIRQTQEQWRKRDDQNAYDRWSKGGASDKPPAHDQNAANRHWPADDKPDERRALS